jgi:hypothetical protein
MFSKIKKIAVLVSGSSGYSRLGEMGTRSTIIDICPEFLFSFFEKQSESGC